MLSDDQSEYFEISRFKKLFPAAPITSLEPTREKQSAKSKSP